MAYGDLGDRLGAGSVGGLGQDGHGVTDGVSGEEQLGRDQQPGSAPAARAAASSSVFRFSATAPGRPELWSRAVRNDGMADLGRCGRVWETYRRYVARIGPDKARALRADR